jgi:hypothetical protein
MVVIITQKFNVWRDLVFDVVQNDGLNLGLGELYPHVYSSLVDEAFSVPSK